MEIPNVLHKLYVGYFGRAPEPAGYNFWSTVIASGFPVVDIAEDFARQPEARALYPDLGTSQPEGFGAFLTSVYQNLFGRMPDDEGLQFWLGVLEDGFSIGQVILAIIEGAGAQDEAVLDQKLEVAEIWLDLARDEPAFALTQQAIEASKTAIAAATGRMDNGATLEALTQAFFNDPPTISVQLAVGLLDTDRDTSERFKIADITVADDAFGRNQLSLAGRHAELFEIDGTEVFLQAGADLSNKSDGVLDFRITVNDPSIAGTPDDSVDVLIVLNQVETGPEPVNQPPTIALSNAVMLLPEDTDTSDRTKIADIVIGDDGLGANTLTLAGADAALFEIDGSTLYLRAGVALDFETRMALDVTVSVDDPALGDTPVDAAALQIAVAD